MPERVPRTRTVPEEVRENLAPGLSLGLRREEGEHRPRLCAEARHLDAGRAEEADGSEQEERERGHPWPLAMLAHSNRNGTISPMAAAPDRGVVTPA